MKWNKWKLSVIIRLQLKSAWCTHWVCSVASVWQQAPSPSAGSPDNHNLSTCTAWSGLLWFSSRWPVKHSVPLSVPVTLSYSSVCLWQLGYSNSWRTGLVAPSHRTAAQLGSEIIVILEHRQKKLSECWTVEWQEWQCVVICGHDDIIHVMLQSKHSKKDLLSILSDPQKDLYTVAMKCDGKEENTQRQKAILFSSLLIWFQIWCCVFICRCVLLFAIVFLIC